MNLDAKDMKQKTKQKQKCKVNMNIFTLAFSFSRKDACKEIKLITFLSSTRALRNDRLSAS